jgi:hypothetical protein
MSSFSFFFHSATDAFFNWAIGGKMRQTIPSFKKIPKTEAAAAAQGLASMKFFFSVKKSPGRPAKKMPKSGRPAAEKAPAPAAAQEASAVKPTAKKPKARRTSYSKGEGLMKMTNAIAAWKVEQQKTPEARLSMHLFAEVHDIPFTTLQTQITPDDSKRIKLGSGVGRKPVLDDQQEVINIDVLIRKDRANEGASVGEAADILDKICPGYSRKQFDQAFRHTLRPQYSERMTDPVAAQATTTKRTAITLGKQWRWHKVKY